ncbi:MAG: T9SS type A sorting domain-containing protein [Candidatus Kapaibacterium sp.]
MNFYKKAGLHSLPFLFPGRGNKSSAENNNFSLDLSGLANGSYLCSISFDDKVVTKKLIIRQKGSNRGNTGAPACAWRCALLSVAPLRPETALRSVPGTSPR